MKHVLKIAIVIIFSLFTMSSHAAKTTDGDKVDLTVIEARLSALETALADRQLTGPNKYDGTYTTTIMESQYYGCQPAGTDVTSVLTDQNGATTVTYFVNQQLSSSSTRTASFDATSSGGLLVMPNYDLLTHGLRLSGIAEIDSRVEGDFSLTVNADGSLTVDAGPDVTVSGQFSADGSTFTYLVEGQFVDNACNDNFMVIAVGVRK